MKRCKWCNLKNKLYVKYHDEEWCKLNLDDKYLFEMLILESFQAGLSWECVLNKRESFRKAFDNFDINKICNYDDNKIQELLDNKNIIRNKSKIKAVINNSKIFKNIQNEYSSFHNYLNTFRKNTIIYETDKTTNELSDTISKDLQKRGMKFVGSTIIYSYLQAIGIIYSHDEECFLYKKGECHMQNETNMEIKIIVENCPQNHKCPAVKICPTGALSQNGFEAPKINYSKCIKCGKCSSFCPRKALVLDKKNK